MLYQTSTSSNNAALFCNRCPLVAAVGIAPPPLPFPPLAYRKAAPGGNCARTNQRRSQRRSQAGVFQGRAGGEDDEDDSVAARANSPTMIKCAEG